MIALWIVLAVAVVGLLVTAVTATRVRRRPPAAPRPPEPAPAPPAAPRPPEPAPAPPAGAPGFRERLGRTRGLFSGLRALRGRGAVEGATWDDLEEALLRADVGVATTEALLDDLRRRVASKEIAGGDQLLGALRGDLVDLLEVEERWDGAAGAEPAPGRPVPADAGEAVTFAGRGLRFDAEPGVVNVWLFVGVNGVGKTTTVGKVARREVAAGRSVLLAAGDTFRAAAGEQLALWAARTGAEIVRGAEGGDPSAVVYDAVQRAAARGNDLVLADTAGRLHTKVNLVEELKKIRRVADRPPGRVTEVLLVLDATTGQNGLVQARQFTEAVGCTGVVLTKLDGTAKGGVVVAVQRELGLPVKLVGLGEGPDDLVPFDPAAFVDALLS
jgi:fused signal recognition particle receptor